MPRQNFKLAGHAFLLSMIFAAYPVIGHTAPAARVDFAVGNVKAIGPNGQSRTVAKGAQIEQGETISTNNGRAQLRFTDGAYVSLQPESEFRIDQYRFDGKQDGNEKGFFSLVKGGLRTITGLVGRTNKNNYQVTTSVATIGIRGTEYTIQYGQSVVGTVGEGEINVCNAAGCLSVTNGESYYVQNQEVKPVLTNKRTDLPPPEPNSPPSTFVRGDDQVAPPFMFTGTQVLNSVTGVFCDGACISPSFDVMMVFDSAGKLTSYESIVPASVRMGGNDGVMAWGTFQDPQSFGGLTHFVVGLPVPAGDLSNLAGTTGTYSLIGSTPLTDFSGQTVGQLTGASLAVNFGGSAVASAGLNWTLTSGTSLSATMTGTGSGSNLLLGSCGASCLASAELALFGPNAVRAGMAYKFQDSVRNIDGMGAAAFAKK